MREPSIVEHILKWLGWVFLIPSFLMVTLTIVMLAINTLSMGFNKAQELATSGSADVGAGFVVGLGLLFGHEVLKRLREIADKS
jgi:hypothetical protein